MNNAKLLPFGLYDQSGPAFAALFEQQGRDWRAFYAAVAALVGCQRQTRQAKLEGLMQHRLELLGKLPVQPTTGFAQHRRYKRCNELIPPWP